MFRETATHIEDLPHAYVAATSDPAACTVCRGDRWDARHVAFETAAEHPTVAADLPRERGA